MALANIRIAVGKQWKDRDSGAKKESTEWVPVVFFNGLAEVAGKYLKKGSRIRVNGEFRTRKWQAQDGSDRYTTQIIASEMQMLDSPQSGSRDAYNAPRGGAAPHQAAPRSAPDQGGFDDFDSSDIPF